MEDGVIVMQIGYGTYVSADSRGPANFFAEARLAEAAGFDAIFYSEHHGVDGYPASPVALAAMALAATTILRAGPMPLLLPLHNAVRIGEEAALIDFISGGRFILGVGAGYHELDFGQVGLDPTGRGKRLEEAVTVIRSLWSAHPVPFQGEHYVLGNDRPLFLKPAQPGGPPIWMGTGSRTGTRRAARFADGIVLSSVPTFDAITTEVQRYRDACAELGQPVGTVAVMRRGCIGDPAEVDAFIELMLAEYARHSDLAGTSGPISARTLAAEQLSPDSVRRRAFIGDAAAVAAQLVDFADHCQVDYLILKLQWTGMDHARVVRQLERWREVVDSANRPIVSRGI